MNKEIEDVEDAADARFDVDFLGIAYTSIYAGITSVTGASAMNYAGVVASQGMPLAVAVIFVAYVLPKAAEELDRRHRLNEAKQEGYIAGRLEKRKGQTNLLNTFFFIFISQLGKASLFTQGRF